MIKTQSYNDFSSFSDDEKKDYNFMLEEIKLFTKNGGDISLLVKDSSSNINEANLISFNSFIVKHIENHAAFLNELVNQGIIRNQNRLATICEFTWNSSEGSITEKANYGIYWIRDNFNEFKEDILQSFKNLLEDLPNDLSEVKIFNQINHQGKIQSRSLNHPLYSISTEVNQPELYDLIFTSRPEIKDEFLKNSITTKEPKFLHIINRHETHVLIDNDKNFKIAMLFYKHGIAADYFHQNDNLTELHRLIVKACYTGDIDFLNIVLPNIDLCEIETNRINEPREFSLCRAKNIEIAELLLKHNAVIEKSYNTPNGLITNNIVLNEEITKIEVLDYILNKLPNYQEQIKNDPVPFYKMMQNRPLSFTKLLVEKYQFPLENFDMLSIAYKKTNIETFEDYKWLAQHGADLRENKLFCAEMVHKREIGLKIIRGLNKEGIIVSKSPDFVFNIFQNSPTKNFITYYDKLSATELEKTTKQDFPAWWGAKSYSDYMFMFNRIKNYDQKTSDGKNLLFHLLERQLDNRGINPNEIIKLQLKKLKIQDSEYKLDLSYTNTDGNNFLHFLLSFRKHYKDHINLDLLEILKNNSQQSPFEFLSKENKVGISPMDLFLTQDNVSNYDYSKTLQLLIEQAPEFINFNKMLSTGQTIADYFIENFKHDPNMKNFVDATILQQELSSNKTKTKKMKL